MANGTELNKRLQFVERKYEALYKSFMSSCQNEEKENFEARTSLVTYMKSHSELVHNKLIPELLSSGSPVKHECDLNIYEHFYEDNDDMLLSYTEIEKDAKLKDTYLSNGADVGAFALTTAHHWMIENDIAEPDINEAGQTWSFFGFFS